jgi:hypothetical protein
MTLKDIDELFTKTVTEYLSKGFLINSHSFGGHQTRQIALVDLTDGKDIYRVLLEESDFDGSLDYFGIDCLAISVRRIAGEPVHATTRHTIWNDRGELISERKFYKFVANATDFKARVRKEHNPWFTESLEEAKAAYDKNYERHMARLVRVEDKHEFPDSVKRNLLPLVRRFPRCKTVHLEHIGRVWRDKRTYFFEVKGHTYTINLKKGA